MRLIDADALIRKFKTASPMAIDGRARQIVEEMQTVEPRKGTWIDFCGSYQCSCCNMTNAYEDNYCPNCGADMRGEQP